MEQSQRSRVQSRQQAVHHITSADRTWMKSERSSVVLSAVMATWATEAHVEAVVMAMNAAETIDGRCEVSVKTSY